MPNSAYDNKVSGPIIPGLAGKRVLITGASSGIGNAMARAFGRCGAAVALHYNSDREGAEAAVAVIRDVGGEAVSLQADLTDPVSAAPLVEKAASELGGLDVLINNAGGPLALMPVADMTDAHFDAVFNLNARSAFVACRAAIPLLREAGGGGASIINVTSLSARLGGSVGAGLYAASKAFLAALTKNLSRELAPEQIRVNALSPGYVETPLHAGFSPPDLVRSWVAQIPLGRAGMSEDCVGAALFLASPTLSGFITGQVVEVNGGQFTGG